MDKIGKLSGIGRGRKCLIIGAGFSVSRFDFDKIPADIVKIGLNFLFIPVRIDYNLFVDRKYSFFLERSGLNDRIKLIGFEENITDKIKARVDYSFNFGDTGAGSHSGYFALKIAQDIMKFDQIYLIGFDYFPENGMIHYYGDHYISEKNIDIYKYKYFDTFIEDFKNEEWRGEIYNLNPESRLKIFPIARRIK